MYFADESNGTSLNLGRCATSLRRPPATAASTGWVTYRGIGNERAF